MSQKEPLPISKITEKNMPDAEDQFIIDTAEGPRKTKMERIYERMESSYLGVITPSSTIPPTGSWHGTVLEPGTFNNVTPAITVNAADFDVQNGMANNEVRIIISDGVATKDVRRVKGDAGNNGTNTIPIYNAANTYAAGLQFEKDGVTYQVKAGQTFNAGETVEGSAKLDISIGFGNLINVTKLFPPSSGYHTATTARAAVPVKLRRQGAIISYQVGFDSWIVEQYLYSDTTVWTNATKWVRLLDIVAQSVLYQLETGLKTLMSKNLFNQKSTNNGYALANNTGLPSVSANSNHSNFIPISDSKKYILSGFQNATTNVVRVAVFYDITGKIIDTGWSSTGKPYSLASVDNDTYPAERSFYILAPATSVPADWKTNGLATLPIPAGAAFIRFNTGAAGYDWRPFFMLEETTADTPSSYEEFGFKSENIIKTAAEIAFDLRTKAVQNEVFTTNLFDISKRLINRHLATATGLEKVQADISGRSFAISDYIDVIGGKAYYLANRQTQVAELPDARAIVFYDVNNNLLKPVDKNGVEYSNYSLPYLNGIVYAPQNAVKVRFTCMWHSVLPEVEDIMFLTSSENSETFIPFGSYIRKDFVIGNKTAIDGQVMLKDGDSFIGVAIEEIASQETLVDDIYVLKDFIAGAKARYPNIEIPYSNILPENGFATTADGTLVFMKNGVRYNVNMTQV